MAWTPLLYRKGDFFSITNTAHPHSGWVIFRRLRLLNRVNRLLHSVALRYYIFGDTLNGAYDSLFDIPDENRKESLLNTASLQLDMKHLEKTIQQILIGELQEKGYSQKDIAKLLNVSRQTIFNKLHR